MKFPLNWRILAVLLCWIRFSHGETVEDLLRQQTLSRIEKIAASVSGVVGFAALDLNTGRWLTRNADVEFPQASSIKIAILTEMMAAAKAGKFQFSDPITLTPQEAVGGTGHLSGLLAKGPHTLSIEELITAMMQTSDNTATNRCIRMVGIESVNRRMSEAGFPHIRLRRRMMDSEAAARDQENTAPPMEMVLLMEKIYRGELVDGESSAHMIRLMKLVKADFRRSIPPAIEVAAKPGELTGVRSETGVVYLKRRPFVLSVGSTFLREGENPVPEIATAIFEYFQKLDRSNRYGRALE